MLLKDTEIKFLAENCSMIDPFVPAKVKCGLSYGLSSTGYDIRLSDEGALEVLRESPNSTEIDPKNAQNTLLTRLMKATKDTLRATSYFILPPQGVMLGVAVEKLSMPNNVMAICMTKSSYARVGVFANITPVEAGWKGYLTMEIKNFNQNSAVRIYTGEGIAQLLFMQVQGEPKNPYGDGKYQDQGNSVVLSR